MTTLDLSPAPGRASTRRRVWAHARTEAMLLVRNGEQLLLALVIPIGLLILGRFVGDRIGLADSTQVPPSVFAVAILSSAFTSIAIATGFERRYGVLERLSSTPLGRSGLIAGKALSLVIVTAGQVVILVLVAVLLGWRPTFSLLALLVAIGASVVGVVAFAAWALVISGTMRAEITLALANLIYLLLLVAGGILIPLDQYPTAVAPVVAALPTSALGEVLRQAAVGEILLWPVGILCGWAVVGLLTARKVFRWSS